MTYVISEPCVGVKDASCTSVCPVDCIHPTTHEPDWDLHDQLYSNPTEYIDCEACVVSCPVGAISPADAVPAECLRYIDKNAAYFREPEN